jgi:hypothetical protein
MANSFRKIDYRLRPAKSVERRMMAEAFLRLREFGAVESYRYVGMGSVYFSDFALFHSVCGFESMVSIEDVSDPTVQQRFVFNRPLANIDLKFKHSNLALPELPWDIRTVAWMDYDGALDASVLTDVSFLASKLCPGSVLAISVNCDLEDTDEGTKTRFQVLSERVGLESLPHSLTSGGTVRPAEVPALFKQITTTKIVSALNARNAGRPTGQKICAEQIFFFKYHDGAPMLTFGWVFFDEGQRQNFLKCGFDQLSFARGEDEFFDIRIPLITGAEIRELNRHTTPQLPVPPSEVTKHSSVKRYWTLGSMQELT